MSLSFASLLAPLACPHQYCFPHCLLLGSGSRRATGERWPPAPLSGGQAGGSLCPWAMASPPWTEEALDYAVEEFPFEAHVRDILYGDGNSSLALAEVHCLPDAKQRGKRLRAYARPQMVTGLVKHDGFRATYHKFIREFLRPHFGEDYLIFEHNPNLRVHAAGGKALTLPHKDEDHLHSPSEINFWLPLTSAYGAASLWAESLPGHGDFHPFEVGYGQVVRFWGNKCMHFTMDNTTSVSRVSFDFRVVRLRDFARSGIPEPGQESGERWTLFSYYDVMGPNGLVGLDGWPAIASIARSLGAQSAGAERPGASPGSEVETRGPPGGPLGGQGAVRRQRSSSQDHQRGCVARHGCERNARQRCARCGWIAQRGKLLGALVHTSGGADVPWIAENPDLEGPWGLGCLVCHAASRKGLLDNHPSMAFSEFTFGTGHPGLLCGALFRHGNHAKRQQIVGTERPLIACDGAHQIALEALHGCEKRVRSVPLASEKQSHTTVWSLQRRALDEWVQLSSLGNPGAISEAAHAHRKHV